MREVFCIVMAGGGGERFWPCSREKKPKQFLDLFGQGTLLEQTLARLRGFADERHILIVTSRSYVAKIAELCPQIPPENIIGEPCGRDTAPCLALAAGIVGARAKTKDPVLVLLPSDHRIADVAAMTADFRECVEIASREKALTTIGIVPDRPSPDYGYIECGRKLNGFPHVCKVARFREKPDIVTAEKLLAHGECRWNSGIFFFPLQSIAQEMQTQAPDLWEFAEKVRRNWGTKSFRGILNREYRTIRKISLDYAILEHARKVLMKESSFDWDDVGNWSSLRNYLDRDENSNATRGNTFLLDSKNCIVYSGSPRKRITGIDLDGFVIVETRDTLLICPEKSLSKIKTLLHAMRENGGSKKR